MTPLHIQIKGRKLYIPSWEFENYGSRFAPEHQNIIELKPNFDPLDLNLDDFSDALQSQSISNIRLKLISVLRDVFGLVRSYTAEAKKLFYAASLLLVIADAVSYLRSYYCDDSFDNFYVDDNLRRIWKNDRNR